MKKTVFDFTDYKTYLTKTFEDTEGKGYGSRTKLAKALNCNVAFVSQVLNKSAHFSLEHGELINQFLGHSKTESHFFLLLIQYGRAGTLGLRRRIQEQIDEILERRRSLKERVDIKKSLSELDQTQYYSAWYFSAAHLLVTIEEFQTKEALAKKLGLSLQRINSVLDFLTSIGLVIEDGAKLKPGVNRLFLDKDSLMIAKHHTNWRIKAIDSLDREKNDDLHFSTLFTFAKSDYPKIQQTLIDAIESARALVRETKTEEDIACFNLDFFKI